MDSVQVQKTKMTTTPIVNRQRKKKLLTIWVKLIRVLIYWTWSHWRMVHARVEGYHKSRAAGKWDSFQSTQRAWSHFIRYWGIQQVTWPASLFKSQIHVHLPLALQILRTATYDFKTKPIKNDFMNKRVHDFKNILQTDSILPCVQRFDWLSDYGIWAIIPYLRNSLLVVLTKQNQQNLAIFVDDF